VAVAVGVGVAVAVGVNVRVGVAVGVGVACPGTGLPRGWNARNCGSSNSAAKTVALPLGVNFKASPGGSNVPLSATKR
jgi:hypothetical protein